MTQSLEDRVSSLASGYVIEARGLTVEDPANLPLEKWRHIGRDIVSQVDRCNWALGDWINLARGSYGDTYHLAEVITGFSYDWLGVLAATAKAYSKADRLTVRLAWSYFRYAVSLPHHDRMNYLKLAEMEGLTIAQFRSKIAAFNESKRTPEQSAVIKERVKARSRATESRSRKKAATFHQLVRCPKCRHEFAVDGNEIEAPS